MHLGNSEKEIKIRRLSLTSFKHLYVVIIKNLVLHSENCCSCRSFYCVFLVLHKDLFGSFNL